MFVYNDYFDEKLQGMGYAGGEAEIADHIHLLDMILEHYLDAKTKHSEGLVFSRGMKMTEAEIESYYFKKPAERISIGYDEAFSDEVKKAKEHIKKRTEASKVTLPIETCRQAFSLSDEGVMALVLALSVQTDLKYTRLFGYIANESSLQYPTLGVYLALTETFDKEGIGHAAELFDDKSSFFRFCLDHSKTKESITPFLHQPLVIQPVLLSYILGTFKTKEKKEHPGLPDSYQAFEKRLKDLEKREGRYYIECPDGEDIEAVLDIDDSNIIDMDKGGDLFGMIAGAALTPGRKVVFSTDVKKLLDAWDELSVFPVLFIYGGVKIPDELLHGDYMTTPVELPLPDANERLSVWQALIKKEGIKLSDDVSVEAISDTYSFSYSRICEVVRMAARMTASKGEKEMDRAGLLSVIFRYNAANFAGLATRVHTAYVWDDIEIAEAQRKRLIVACDRYRLRDRIDEKYGVGKRNAYGNGVSVLMYGAPGTGKTMAAQVVANELGLPLYRVDVSQIFSKYIGETEKNLGVIFEEAKKANVILFFDEADALFAKRTEVGDSNDRYANAETAYLLQKIEEHNGMTILATNLYHNFDAAFVRRITYVVHIDSPDEATRLRLWQHTLPDTCRFASDVDFEFLAENFELSGSNIKAILQTAAYYAGGFDRAITMGDVIMALRYELEKLGRIIDSTDFGNYGVYL